MLLALTDEKTDTFSQFSFKFYKQFKAEDPCYLLNDFFFFGGGEYSSFLVMIEVLLLI